jgi:hypothetical protein
LVVLKPENEQRAAKWRLFARLANDMEERHDERAR